VAVAPSGAVNVSAAAGSVRAAVNVSPTGNILPTSTGAVQTLLGQIPVGSNPTTLVGTGSLANQGAISLPSGH
jgi:hypothetical protein